ncbi:thioredoxin domain-containing protein [Candidatus Uhrbacteria bacterium]|jgi:protein-disulfide isomerase|nr:thioredoxin domain-containing protein [Candidatus Uhrbacteria bacterium]MBT7717020.1 thioredoxin domain-containing protein [Candidatus Uhrbacteria bacterium]
MQNQKKGFFDGNPKMLLIFGLVSGIAITLLFNNISDLSLTSTTSDTDEPTVITVNNNEAQAPTANNTIVPPITDDDHIRGDVDAPLTWIEYSDFECPFCKRFMPTMDSMLEDYEGEIKLIFRHFPLSFHLPLAMTQAEATECANEFAGNDAFWDMHDYIFNETSSNGNGMSEGDLVNFAVELGIDESDFQTCLDDDRYEDHINEDIAGGASAGVTGTPGSIFIDADGNAQLISGAIPYSSIQSIIDASLR